MDQQFHQYYLDLIGQPLEENTEVGHIIREQLLVLIFLFLMFDTRQVMRLCSLIKLNMK